MRHHDLSKTEEVRRYDDLMVAVEPLCLLGSKNEEMKDYVVHTVRAAIEKLRLSLQEGGTSKEGDNIQVSPSSVNKQRQSGSCTPVNNTVDDTPHMVEDKVTDTTSIGSSSASPSNTPIPSGSPAIPVSTPSDRYPTFPSPRQEPKRVLVFFQLETL